MTRLYVAALLGAGLLAASADAATTGVTGSGGPYYDAQPTLVLNVGIRVKGIYPFEGGSSVGAVGKLTIFPYDVPKGYLPADGRSLPIATNQVLYSLLGTTYGGDGRTTFKLPDARGRMMVGVGTGVGLNQVQLGESAGEFSRTLTTANLPPHAHDVPGGTTSVVGSGAPLDIRQPWLGVNYTVPMTGYYPGRDFAYDPAVGSEDVLGFVYANAVVFSPYYYTTANGATVPISTNTAEFSLLGTTFGGNGVSNFQLPDLQGRAPVGAGQGPGLIAHQLGGKDGSDTTVLTLSEMPAHTHTLAGGALTGSTGGSDPIPLDAPTTTLNYIIALGGGDPSALGTATENEPLVGQIELFAGNFAPTGWAFCDGQSIPKADDPALYSAIGGSFGSDATTFRLPDLRGRVVVGTELGVPNLSFGNAFGDDSLVLQDYNLPPHAHDYTAVPEPASLGLLAVGALGLLLRRR